MSNLFFRDNFFNAGVTEILNEKKEVVGHLDLKSAFSYSLDVYGPNRKLLYRGKHPFFSFRWEITDGRGKKRGVLRYRFSVFTKKYRYETDRRGVYEIRSPGFSREYEVFDEAGKLVARFARTDSWFGPGAYMLENHSQNLDDYELVAVVMGMNALQRMQNNGAV